MVAKKKYDLAAIIEAERGKNPPIIIEAGKETFEILAPIFWADEVFEVSDVESAKMLLGDRYEAFCAAGGTAALLFSITRKASGANRPE